MSPDSLRRRGDEVDLVEALEDLEAAASKVRRLLAENTRRHGYRATAAMAGLTVHTVQRWRHEVPPSPALRAAQARRTTTTERNHP